MKKHTSIYMNKFELHSCKSRSSKLLYLTLFIRANGMLKETIHPISDHDSLLNLIVTLSLPSILS